MLCKIFGADSGLLKQKDAFAPLPFLQLTFLAIDNIAYRVTFGTMCDSIMSSNKSSEAITSLEEDDLKDNSSIVRVARVRLYDWTDVLNLCW